MRSGPWVVCLSLGLFACGGDFDPVDGLDLQVRGGAMNASGARERCLELTATEAPLTLDRVAFEADEPAVTPHRQVWTDVAVSGTYELCFFVCACEAGEIGHFVVDDDGRRSSADVDWPAGECCVAEEDGGT